MLENELPMRPDAPRPRRGTISGDKRRTKRASSVFVWILARAPGTLIDAQLLLGFRAQPFRSPRWRPHHIHGGVANARQLFEPRLYLHADVDMLRAALRGQRHIDGDVLFVFFH